MELSLRDAIAMSPFTETQLDNIVAQIEAQRRELEVQTREGTAAYRCYEGLGFVDDGLPEKQAKAIEEATQEKADRFLVKLMSASGGKLRKSLCEEGGVLYKQWETWGDLNNKDVLRMVVPLLTGTTLSGQVLVTVAIAVSVIIVHLGKKKLCNHR